MSSSPPDQPTRDFLCDLVAKAPPGLTVGIDSPAGSGKSTLLLQCANRAADVGRTALILAFNRSVAKSMRVRCGEDDRISCFTTDSLISLSLPPLLREAPLYDLGTPKEVKDLMRALRVYNINPEPFREELADFLSGSVYAVDGEELARPSLHVQKAVRELERGTWSCFEGRRWLCAEYGYLSDLITMAIKPDIILLDEAQDTAKAVARALAPALSRCVFMAVGDKLQTLYSYMGAGPIDLVLPPKCQFTLTTTFRFGKDIASFVSGRFPSKKIETAVGAPPGRVVQLSAPPNVAAFGPGPITCLFRTWRDALLFVLDAGIPLHQTKSLTDSACDSIVTWLYLKDCGEDRIRRRPGPNEILLERLGRKRLLSIIEHFQRPAEETADEPFVIGTVHAAKGGEWDRVYVSPTCFRKPSKEGHIPASGDAACIEYVALTRARRELFAYF